ncbi:MAG TPA: hypothetical protein DCZ20_01820 [Lachnospiraceae bacterium]|nr:hypothetical protein [Lachnospiraceae bacterium]
MTINTEDILNSILASLSRIDYIKPEDIPNINLYMDQVTTFMEEQLNASRRYPDDKILTKTMINNYAKNHLLPAPVKKKYTKEHILILIFIYYFKNILSIKDIDSLLSPLTTEYFNTESEFDLTAIYNEVFSLENDRIDILKEDIQNAYQTSRTTFQDVSDENKEYLQLFSFLCTLSFDVYVKKQLIEKIIDTLPEPDHTKKKK